MSKKVRSIFSLAVALCMIFSLAAVNVSAASVARTATIELSATEGAPGEEISVGVFLSDTVNTAGIGYYLVFSADVFEINTSGVHEDLADEGFTYGLYVDNQWMWDYLETSSGKKWGDLSIGSRVDSGNIQISVQGSRTNGISTANNRTNVQIGGFTLKVKDGATAGPATITLAEAETIDAGEALGAPMIFTPQTFTVLGGAPPVDKSALASLIADAEDLLDDYEEGTAVGNVPVGAKATLQAAIDDAQAVYDDADAIQDDVDQAVIDLQAAMDAFEDSVITTPPTDDPVIKIVSAGEVVQGENIIVQVKADKIPAGATGVAFGIEFDKDVFEVVADNIVGNDAYIDYDIGDVIVDNGTLGFAGTFDPAAVIDGEIIVASITFTAKDDAAEGETTLSFIDANYGTGDFVDQLGAAITVTSAADIPLEEAENALAAFKDAILALDSVDEAALTAINGLKSDAEAKIAALAADHPEKARLEGEFDDACDDLDAKIVEIALANINAGTYDIDEFKAIDSAADSAKLGLYENAIALAKEYMSGYDVLDAAEIADIIAVANAFDAENDAGDVKDDDGINLNDAAWVRDLFLGTASNITIAKLLRADIGGNGTISATDIVDILLIVAKNIQL